MRAPSSCLPLLVPAGCRLPRGDSATGASRTHDTGPRCSGLPSCVPRRAHALRIAFASRAGTADGGPAPRRHRMGMGRDTHGIWHGSLAPLPLVRCHAIARLPAQVLVSGVCNCCWETGAQRRHALATCGSDE
ncbi:hypothetical protein BDA96_06G238400 [Sorghum bicolor]|uniref:Uncharacterized protein n=1 Tax=Sorghum bicolor TaxID=4558 RepID=A0A921UEJ8_SORBI|nr:hypothetical protein BDA96_06G238400 [Sorghum bicolor]